MRGGVFIVIRFRTFSPRWHHLSFEVIADKDVDREKEKPNTNIPTAKCQNRKCARTEAPFVTPCVSLSGIRGRRIRNGNATRHIADAISLAWPGPPVLR